MVIYSYIQLYIQLCIVIYIQSVFSSLELIFSCFRPQIRILHVQICIYVTWQYYIALYSTTQYYLVLYSAALYCAIWPLPGSCMSRPCLRVYPEPVCPRTVCLQPVLHTGKLEIHAVKRKCITGSVHAICYNWSK